MGANGNLLFRADHVGSMLRPKGVLGARARGQGGASEWPTSGRKGAP